MTTITFGRYQGSTLEDVWSKDPTYILSLIKNPQGDIGFTTDVNIFYENKMVELFQRVNQLESENELLQDQINGMKTKLKNVCRRLDDAEGI
jgi:hypothetical protein